MVWWLRAFADSNASASSNAADGPSTSSFAASPLSEAVSTSSSQQQAHVDAPNTASTPQEAPAATSSKEVKKKEPKKYDPMQIPSPMQIIQEDAMNNCFVKGVISCVMGGLAGVAFGLFSASIDNAGVGTVDSVGVDYRDKPTRQVLKEMAKHMKDKSVSFAKGFAVFGAVYSFNECVIEKYRAKHDKINPALAGCATGAMMAYAGGPQAMCFGCVSVGAFSAAIEHFLDM